MIKILFLCYGSILKCLGRARKINDFMAKYGTYYTILKEPRNDIVTIEEQKKIRRHFTLRKGLLSFICWEKETCKT